MDTSAWIALASLVIAVVGTIIGTVWKQTNWITNQFKELMAFVDEKVHGVLDKLEYHEKHDDDRFASLQNDIWMLRLDNAQSKTNKIANVRRETESSDQSFSRL